MQTNPSRDQEEIIKLKLELANQEQTYSTLIHNKNIEITALKLRLTPAICEITPALLDAGLLAWGQDAVSAVDSTQGKTIMGLVMDLKMVAIEQPSISQCDRMKELFVTIGQMSGVWPTSDQAKAMQEILDAGCPSTGPVKEEFLSFKPWQDNSFEME